MIRCLVAGALLFAAIAKGYAVDLTIYSQNLLHFGQGTATATSNKCAALNNAITTVDVIVIQELMLQAYPCGPVPAGFAWLSMQPPNQGSYKEYYGLLYRVVAGPNGSTLALLDLNPTYPFSGFVRTPPAYIFLVTTGTGKQSALWIANIHSVWGKTVGGRQQEALNAANFAEMLRTSTLTYSGVSLTGNTPVIFAGDWNLPVKYADSTVNAGFTAFVQYGYSIQPTVQTTLTPSGVASASYDHFVFRGLNGVGFSVYPTTVSDWPVWRSTVSDHLGIMASFTFH